MVNTRGPSLAQPGFTIVEIMMVLAIMGMLSAMAIVQIGYVPAGSDRRRRDAGRHGSDAQRPGTGDHAAPLHARDVHRAVPRSSVVREDTPTTTTPMSETLFESGVQIRHGDRRCPTRPTRSARRRRDRLRSAVTNVIFSSGHARQPGRPHRQRHRVPRPSEPGVSGPRGHGARIDRTYPRLQVGRPWMEAGVVMPRFRPNEVFRSSETVIALGVLTTGVLGSRGRARRGHAEPEQLAVRRHRHAEGGRGHRGGLQRPRLPQDHLGPDSQRQGRDSGDGGIFLDGPQPLKTSGLDGLVNTDDDGGTTGAIERRGCCRHLTRSWARPTTRLIAAVAVHCARSRSATCRERERPTPLRHGHVSYQKRSDEADLHAESLHLRVLVEDRPVLKAHPRRRFHARSSC